MTRRTRRTKTRMRTRKMWRERSISRRGGRTTKTRMSTTRYKEDKDYKDTVVEKLKNGNEEDNETRKDLDNIDRDEYGYNEDMEDYNDE